MGSLTRTGTAVERPRTVASVLLARRGSVFLPRGSETAATPSPLVSAGVVLLEVDLLHRGYLMSVPLREHLLRLDEPTLRSHGQALLSDLDSGLGADRTMVPQFRGFPSSVPENTAALYVDRVLALLFQQPEQPCVLCQARDAVHAVSPCGHLVCRRCFDGADYAGCPICHRRIDPDDPFLRPAEPRGDGTDLPLPERTRVLFLGTDSGAAVRSEVDALLARPGALSVDDRLDLRALLDACDPTDVTWLPDELPGRETRALVLDWLLTAGAGRPEVLTDVAHRLQTATDVLRLLVVRSGGDPGLVGAPRFGPVPRPLRRLLLGVLDRADPRTVVEDLRRYRRLWIHAAERLHPFEHARAHPRAAAAFAELRGTRLRGDLLDRVTEAVPELDLVEGPRLRSATLRSRVERCLAQGDATGALHLLRTRPGELLRRLDHLLRLDPEHPALPSAVAEAAQRVAPAVLLSALGAVRVRDRSHDRRVYFPKGGSARAHVVEDTRAPLPPSVVAEIREALIAEVLDRAGRLSTVDNAVVDARLATVIAPFTQRTAARALVTLPRGSAMPVPPGHRLRMFLHWMEADETVDLDLSAAFFDADWTHVGTCDYTSLRFQDDGAVHSGDFTSAPPPTGATEFLDLDLATLAQSGVRYVVVAVFSYNDVPFDRMAEAFAGVMTRDDAPAEGAVFEPRTVEQRFDLAGRNRASVPFLLDLSTRELRWLDMTQGVSGTFHAVHRHHDQLAVMGASLDQLYRSGARVTLGELAIWQAAARAATVWVRAADATLDRYVRRDGESVAAFAGRVTRGEPDEAGAALVEPVELAYLYRGDLPLADGAEVSAIHPADLDVAALRWRRAEDLVAQLVPGSDL